MDVNHRKYKCDMSVLIACNTCCNTLIPDSLLGF